MFLHHFVCSVHFPTVQKHTGFETIPHLYWKNDKGVKPANGFQPAFSGHSVNSRLHYHAALDTYSLHPNITFVSLLCPDWPSILPVFKKLATCDNPSRQPFAQPVYVLYRHI